MSGWAAIGALMLLVPLLWGGGCGRGGKAWGLKEIFPNPSSPPEELGWLEDPDPDKRREAIAVLSSKRRYLQEPYTKSYALALANDPDALVRAAAARALGLAGDPTYLPQLVAALEDASAVVRCDAAWALERVLGDSAVGPLRKHATEDTSPDVRAACCRALGHYALPEVGATLVRALGDADLNVRRQARATLSALTGADVGDRPEDWSLHLEHRAQPVR